MIEHPRRDPLRVRRLPGHPLPLDAPPPHGGTPQEQPGRGEVPRLTPGSGKDLPPAGGAPPGAQEQDSSGEAGAILFIFFILCETDVSLIERWKALGDGGLLRQGRGGGGHEMPRRFQG